VGTRRLREALASLAADLARVPPERVVLGPTSSGALLAVAGDVVVKAHRAGTDPDDLAARVRLAAASAWADCLLAPLVASPIAMPDAGGPPRLVTAWPRVDPVAAEPSTVPWEEAGALLARLHRHAVPGGLPLPGHGAVARVRRALAALASAVPAVDPHDDTELARARRVVDRAAATLPEAAWDIAPAGRPRTVVHGDWHLGQLGRRPGPGPWLLIDPDDLGLGDPAWDLARPAALLAAGLLAPWDWARFVDAYRATGGPAVPPPPAHPWPPLDAVARAGLVQGAAAALRHAAEAGRALDDDDRLLVEACAASARAPG
jgi:aminoglycoside phosphotransferase (APT) family kinase protein